MKEMVVYLVEELGADVNKAALYGETPLMLASSKKHEKIVRYLLKNCADQLLSQPKAATPQLRWGSPHA
jgi:ankyrin repeat protein